MPRFYDSKAWRPSGQLIKNETPTNDRTSRLAGLIRFFKGSIGPCDLSYETILLVVVFVLVIMIICLSFI